MKLSRLILAPIVAMALAPIAARADAITMSAT
jgi:hypothetical protein